MLVRMLPGRPLRTAYRTVSAVGHASGGNKSLKGKRLELWTREEVSRSLDQLERDVAAGNSPQRKALGLLLAPIRRLKDQEALGRVLSIVRMTGVPLENGVGSALVAGLAEAGQAREVRDILNHIQGKLRLQGVVSVLQLACRERDLGLAREMLGKWDKRQLMQEGVGVELVGLSRASGEADILHSVLEIARATGQRVGLRVAEEIKNWARSLPEAYSCEETNISHSGVCTCCGHQLEQGLYEPSRVQLLDAITTTINTEGLGFSPELISNLSRLQARLSDVTVPYKAVVDGLNVSHHISQSFSVMQVLDVVNRLVAAVGGPVLVVARKHLASAMDDLPAFYNFVPSPRDFHIFTTHINEISDDICVIYAALSTGTDCYFVSNDYMSDYVSRLPPLEAGLFRDWQATRQITVDSRRMKLLLPPNHSQKVQSTSSGGWHIPVRREEEKEGESWVYAGRRREEEGELLVPQTWLCIRRSQ